MTLLHHLLAPALQSGGPAVETLEGRALNAAGIGQRAENVAQALAARSVRANEPVLLMIGNEPEDVAGLLGIWSAGAVAVPCHRTTPDLAVALLRDRTGARFKLSGALLETVSGGEPPHRDELEGAALIVFTSGSTGKPKGVIVAHEALAFKLGVLSELLTPREGEVILCPLQLTFIFGIWVTLLGLLAGARTVLVPKFSPVSISAALGQSATLAAVPSILRLLMKQGSSSSRSLRKILTGGEALGVAAARKLGAYFPGAELFDLYGSTETGSCDFCLSPRDQPSGLGTIGRPTKGVSFRIAPVSGHPRADEGELQIQTPARMIGYLDDAAQTTAAFSEGFFKTGDLARLRENGLVELIGRLKEIISRGGNKIAPLEIDGVFAEHPGVSAALTAGVPDSILGETVHVLVVVKEGALINAEDLRKWAAERLERFKVPDAIHFVDTLPSGATGKADRRAAVRVAMVKAGLG